MLNYIENDSVCKSMQLLAYFGEKDIETLWYLFGLHGRLKNKSEKPQDLNSLKKRIVELLENGDWIVVRNHQCIIFVKHL